MRRKHVLQNLLILVLLLFPGLAQADVCVWRDPERTMVRLFPEARDYKTEVYNLEQEQIDRIEALAGMQLHASEKKEFNIYAITAEGHTIGWVLALAGTGEYGVIETVVGIDPDRRIRGVYLQRVRERKRDALRNDAFLGQFDGKTVNDVFNIQPVAGAEEASAEITHLIKKMLAYEAVLNGDPQTRSNSPNKGD